MCLSPKDRFCVFLLSMHLFPIDTGEAWMVQAMGAMSMKGQM